MQAARSRGSGQVLLLLLMGRLRILISETMLTHGSLRVAVVHAIQFSRLMDDGVCLGQALAELLIVRLRLLEKLHVRQAGVWLTLRRIARA